MTKAESVKSYRLQPLYLQSILIMCCIRMAGRFQWVLVALVLVVALVALVAVVAVVASAAFAAHLHRLICQPSMHRVKKST